MIELSGIQKEIVNSDAKNIIVDAGAGAGKTRTLTERVRHILEQGVSPEGVVVITFTNEAADELKSRLTGIKNVSKCFIGTIHSYANKLLKKAGYNFEIFSEPIQTEFMEYLIPTYAFYATLEDYKIFLACDKLMSMGKMKESEAMNKFSDPKVYHEIKQLLGRELGYAYKETVKTICKNNNVIDFDELIKLSTKYFKESNTTLEYLFVDELQDVGYLEYKFLMSLNAKNNFVIGDDYQSIFGFKGGDVHIFLSLMNHPDWKTYLLTDNYRTCKSVLKFANSIIKKADDIIQKDIGFKNENNGKLEFIAKSQLKNFISGLKATEDWFILARSNKDMYMIDEMLTKAKIKHYCLKRSITTNSNFKNLCDTKCIKVMTIHASKGLECENVALYGKFPVNGKGSSDEIKVFYVGLTRAKERCVVFV